MQSNSLVFIVEHMEEFLYEWCLHEYVEMLKYLEGTSVRLVFTNWKIVVDYKGKDMEANSKYLQLLKEAYQRYGNRGALIYKTYFECLNKQYLELDGIGQYLRSEVGLLDMRASKALTSDDRNSLRVFIFGGILGDHPPRDRTKSLRQHIECMRHLGELQLSTDTAILTSKIILTNNKKLQDIPFSNQPQIEGLNKRKQKTVIQMQGFRYVKKSIDYKTGQIGSQGKDEIYMSQGVRRLLLQEQLDVAMFL